jgi:succinate-semialdehyde dehydrogenase / glutarate-semialdehyde dehydrogenase
MTSYPEVQLLIDGVWCNGTGKQSIEVLDPSNEQVLGKVAHAEIADLDRALEASERGFKVWRKVPANQRANLMRKAANILAERSNDIATIISMEHGKPLREARGEMKKAVDLINYFADEAVRTYGRIIPSRVSGVLQMAVLEPIGPVAGFTPWNFPVNQLVRKVGVTLAAGCSMVVKAAEETPASGAALIRAFVDAGLPAGVLNLVFGIPANISNHLIPSPIIRKISFTGSTAVGKQLAALAGQHMKRVTMELGGHAPVIIFGDADIKKALEIVSTNKTRNTGQSCIAPTRILVQDSIYENFVTEYVNRLKSVNIGPGLDEGSRMGPLANIRRIQALELLMADASARGARIRTGGNRLDRKGYFFEPTVLTDVPRDARVMNEEPFGPLAVILPFSRYDDAIAEANRLPFGLASYVYTGSLKTAQSIAGDLESGMVSINHHGVGVPETPFGGVKDSGYGTEGGPDAVAGYMNIKFVTKSV